MRAPITTQESVVIYIRPGRREGFEARGGGLKANSTGSELSAAWNLAARFFFGGNTKAFISAAEQKALHLAQRGESRTCFVGWIVKPKAEKS